MANSYKLGQLVRVTATFTVAATGTATDPGAVTVSVRAADGTLTTPAAVKDSVGVYHVDVTAAQAGEYFVRFVGTSPLVAASEQQFDVQLGHF